MTKLNLDCLTILLFYFVGGEGGFQFSSLGLDMFSFNLNVTFSHIFTLCVFLIQKPGGIIALLDEAW